ncbi:transcription elongation factor 1 homolog [Triticum dicoccoides]|uniref:transcription elongation factor 1 homolog n=1 Tax=Triticum dicoccoides TaxID=85692 RepID=UPI000E7A6DE1|nr:transcription elongation factor 1 homolog [Triticum dicoccoides]
MGKRKSTRGKTAPRKKAEKLDTSFCCPFCNHPNSIDCKIDLKHLVAEASCNTCSESYSTTAHALTEPVDVYAEWIDECEKANADRDRDEDNDVVRDEVDNEECA